MGMTSAAEAKLDARVRPQISELRSRTPYPKRRSDAGPEEAQSPPPAARPAPIRLTRRGRVVVGTLIGIGVAALAAIIWLAVAGQAQASGNAKAGRPAGGTVARVVVQPGQTLWGIAAKVDPGADPRTIIPQIVDMNALSGTAISVGQVLWVPRS
jgi:nucleoid-associated protein YgaU